MGLDITYGCWHGSYSSFNTFRELLASRVGIDLKQMAGFGQTDKAIAWEDLQPDILHELLNHSDSDGSIENRYLKPLQLRLTEIRRELPEKPDDSEMNFLATNLDIFIEGLQRAIDDLGSIEFC